MVPPRQPAILLLVLAIALLWPPEAGAAQTQPAAPPPNFRVAFFGDESIGANAVSVLNLIASEGADMAIVLGDLGYGSETLPQTATNWDAQVSSVLGADFPLFAVAGNHDRDNWPTYQQLLLNRLAQVPGAACSGTYGVQSACTYQGLFFILSGAGTMGSGHDTYIQNQLAADTSVWRICAWHKDQNAMQVGEKPDEVGWGPYEACRLGRAIVATAHEHSYERTKTLSNMQAQTIDPAWPDPGVLRVASGATFAFVSGLGGMSIRDQNRCLPATLPYGCNGEWASISTSNQGANYGALFIDFHVDGNPRKARGYFKDIDGDVIDTFTVISDLPVGGVASVADLPPAAGQAAQAGERDTTVFAIAIVLACVAAAIALGVWRRS